MTHTVEVLGYTLGRCDGRGVSGKDDGNGPAKCRHLPADNILGMTSKPKRDVVNDVESTDESGNTVIRVRRGALRRFDQLKQKGADLPVEIKWDRRTDERRTAAAAAGSERRTTERRQAPPFTWDVADFVVEGDAPRKPEATTPARKSTRKGTA